MGQVRHGRRTGTEGSIGECPSCPASFSPIVHTEPSSIMRRTHVHDQAEQQLSAHTGQLLDRSYSPKHSITAQRSADQCYAKDWLVVGTVLQ